MPDMTKASPNNVIPIEHSQIHCYYNNIRYIHLHSQFLAEDFILKLFILISYVLGRGLDLNQI